MKPENFVYWLQGYFEMTGATTLTEQQVKMVKEHLALVLTKETLTSSINTNVKIGNISISDEIKKSIEDEMTDSTRNYLRKREYPYSDGPTVMFNDTNQSC